MEPELLVDKKRWEDDGLREATGICVRVELPDGTWGPADIAVLTTESLLSWLKSRGGDNPWAEDVVGILLGYGHLHDEEEPE